jgi:hypothetical protein
LPLQDEWRIADPTTHPAFNSFATQTLSNKIPPHGAGQVASCKNEQQKLANYGIPDIVESYHSLSEDQATKRADSTHITHHDSIKLSIVAPTSCM